MRKILLMLLLVAICGLVSGCSTVTIRDKGTAKLVLDPTYESSKPYFFWGLAGEHRIDVRNHCNGKAVKQIQAQNTFLDGFLYFITLGIYAPRSVKIWCET